MMTSLSEQNAANDRFSLSERWILILVGTSLLALGVSGESLWVDEGYSAKLAMQPTLVLWARTLQSILGSEPQMPGYQLYLWVWTRLFGMSEWTMRFANLPWAVLFTATLAWGSERLLRVRRLWLVICLSPFLWFYMNEARPYAMMLGLSMAITVAVLAYARDSEHFHVAPWWTMILLLGLWAVHMLAITLVPSLLVLLFLLRPVPIKTFIRQWLWPILVTMPFYLLLALYYLHTVAGGKGGSIERPGLSNLGFSLYEFLGFGGLGPPRTDLRLHPNMHTLLPYLPTLALGVLAFVLLGVTIVPRLRRLSDRRTAFGLATAFAVGVLVTFGLAYAAHFRLLGRHLAVFPPLLAFLLIAGLRPVRDQRQQIPVFGSLLLLAAVWICSDFKQRVLPSYHKDDYRSAVALARNALANGEPVLWVADRETANYYGLTTTEGLEKGSLLPGRPMEAVSGVCSAARLESSLPSGKPVLVLITDREHFDPGGNCREVVDSLHSTHVASYPDFDAWQVTGGSSGAGIVASSLRSYYLHPTSVLTTTTSNTKLP
jgi:hypothetical protein